MYDPNTFVYRFEDENGYGAYTCRGFAVWWKEIVRLELRTHHPQPGPDVDGLSFDQPWNTERDYWRFGFATKRQAMAWFEHEEARQAMAEAGCLVSMYEIENSPRLICHGRSQCVFKRSEAKLVGRLDPETLTEVRPAERHLVYKLAAEKAHRPAVVTIRDLSATPA